MKITSKVSKSKIFFIKFSFIKCTIMHISRLTIIVPIWQLLTSTVPLKIRYYSITLIVIEFAVEAPFYKAKLLFLAYLPFLYTITKETDNVTNYISRLVAGFTWCQYVIFWNACLPSPRRPHVRVFSFFSDDDRVYLQSNYWKIAGKCFRIQIKDRRECLIK